MIGDLVLKDIKLFFRNQFLAVVSVVGLLFFIAIYFLIPDTVDETIGLAFWIENPDTFPAYTNLQENGSYGFFESEAEMLTALEETNDYLVGLSFPEADAIAVANGEAVTLNAYYAPDIPAEVKQIFEDVLILLANTADPDIVANFERINDTQVTLGNDIYETPISMRDRIMPMLIIFVLSVEVIGLATLIIREIESGTARALITGPVRLSQFFTGKALMGLLLAFVQVFLLVIVTGKIATSPLLLIVTLLLGSLVIVGVGFLIAAVSKDNMSVMAWGATVLLIFGLPGISILLPGLASGWIEIIPSYFFIDALHNILNFEAGWGDVSQNLLMMVLLSIGTIGLGTAVLQRRF